jgi:transcriptional regulator with XRE-family HTH domain
MPVAEYVYAERLGRAIMSLRAARGMKRKELALAAGLSYPYLAELENGAKTASTKTLQSISEALQLSQVDLLRCAEAMPNLEASPEPARLEEQYRPAPSGLPITWALTDSAAAAQESADLVTRVAQRVAALIEEDVRRRLEQDLPALVREELERSQGSRS